MCVCVCLWEGEAAKGANGGSGGGRRRSGREGGVRESERCCRTFLPPRGTTLLFRVVRCVCMCRLRLTFHLGTLLLSRRFSLPNRTQCCLCCGVAVSSPVFSPLAFICLGGALPSYLSVGASLAVPGLEFSFCVPYVVGRGSADSCRFRTASKQQMFSDRDTPAFFCLHCRTISRYNAR